MSQSDLRHLYFVFLSVITLMTGLSSPLNDSQNDTISEVNQTTPDEQTTEPQVLPDIYRLTDEVVPTFYELRIAPDLKNFTFVGKVEIAIHVKFNTDKIVLHSKNLTITSVKVFKMDSSREFLDSSYELDESNDLLVVETGQSLMFNTNYSLIIEFQGVLSHSMRGFYRTSYRPSNTGDEKWTVVTQFEPNYAREAFPCFDEPRFRTTFTIYLAHSRDQLAISNMPFENWQPSDAMSGPDRVWGKFRKSPPMPTYLVSYMVSNLHNVAQTEGNVRVIARKNAPHQAIYALKQGTRALRQLEGYTGISYMLPKLDLVSVPDLDDDGMENWGMVTFRESSLLTDESMSSAEHRQEITQLISHELSHLWFGDLVTPAWYSYLWLKEGFASYFEYFITSAIEPTWNIDQLFVIENVHESLQLEVTAPRPMTTFIRKSKQIENSYDIISYNKAASIIRMLEHMISPSTFRSALHNFLNDGEKVHEGVVIQKNLFDAIDTESQRSSPIISPQLTISQIMKTWTESIGFPLIKVLRNYSDGSIEVTQEPFQDVTTNIILPRSQNWIVPLTFTTKSRRQFNNTRPITWSTANDPTEISENISSTDWILFNLQNVGYYRVNYDRQNWNLLIDQLHQDHEKIHVLNRAQLISDAYNLAFNEYLSYQVPLKLTEYLSKETDMIPWYAAIRAFKMLQSKLRNTPSEEFFKTYLYDLVKKSYETLGYEIKYRDSHVVKIVKPEFLSLACNLGIEDCIQKSVEEYEKNKADLAKVQPDLKPVVYCHALRNSTDQPTILKYLWTTYIRYEVIYERNQILAALTCATDAQVIKKILSKMFDPINTDIRKEDEQYFLDKLDSRSEAVTATLQFIDEKVGTTVDLSDDNVEFLQGLLYSIKDNIRTEDQIEQLRDLQNKFNVSVDNDYEEFTDTLKAVISISEDTIKDAAAKPERVEKEFLQADTNGSESSESSEATDVIDGSEAGSSATLISIPKLLWSLISSSVVLCYSLSRFSIS
ncbi:aminopeptidase N-like [Planococcus citri]|uniref:aminopeptidase N-like n=1 Tax=Planococcus citri TaxID=170843 RepID=UPI0031F82FE6